MAQIFKTFIADEIAQEKLRDRYGAKYKLKVDMSYQHQHKSCKIDIVFTKDKKAYWIFKYKNEYYMNIIEDLQLKDKYSIIDVFTTLMENAKESYEHVSGMQREKRKVLARKKKK